MTQMYYLFTMPTQPRREPRMSLVSHIKQQLQAEYCRAEAGTGPLPTEHQLADRFDVSRGTLRKAMRQLVDEGRLTRYRGKGTFVAPAGGDLSRTTSPAPPRARLIGCIVRTTSFRLGLDAHVAAADRVTERGGLAVSAFSHSDPVHELELIERFKQHPVDAIVLEPTNAGGSMQGYARRAQQIGRAPGLPIALVGPPTCYTDLPSVWFDETAAAYDATTHLIRLGHKRIAHLSYQASPALRARTTGFYNAMHDAGLTVRDGDVLDITAVPASDESLQLGRNAFRLLASLPEPPTAIFSYWTELAAGALIEARAMGRRVPDDLAAIGIGAELSEQARASLHGSVSTVTYDLSDMMVRATDLVWDQPDPAALAHQRIDAPYHLDVGDSTDPDHRNAKPPHEAAPHA